MDMSCIDAKTALAAAMDTLVKRGLQDFKNGARALGKDLMAAVSALLFLLWSAIGDACKRVLEYTRSRTPLVYVCMTAINAFCVLAFVTAANNGGAVSWLPCLAWFFALCSFAFLYLCDSFLSGASRTVLCLRMAMLGAYWTEAFVFYAVRSPHPAVLGFVALGNAAILRVAEQVHSSDDANATRGDGVVKLCRVMFYFSKLDLICAVFGPSVAAGVGVGMLCGLAFSEVAKKLPLFCFDELETEDGVTDAHVDEEVDEVSMESSSTGGVHGSGNEEGYDLSAREEAVHEEEQHAEEYDSDGWDFLEWNEMM